MSDLTPKWTNVIKALLYAYENGGPNGRAEAWRELYRMAEAADQYDVNGNIVRRERIEKIRKARDEAMGRWDFLTNQSRSFYASAFMMADLGGNKGTWAAFMRRAGKFSAEARALCDSIAVIDNELRELGA